MSALPQTTLLQQTVNSPTIYTWREMTETVLRINRSEAEKLLAEYYERTKSKAFMFRESSASSTPVAISWIDINGCIRHSIITSSAPEWYAQILTCQRTYADILATYGFHIDHI